MHKTSSGWVPALAIITGIGLLLFWIGFLPLILRRKTRRRDILNMSILSLCRTLFLLLP